MRPERPGPPTTKETATMEMFAALFALAAMAGYLFACAPKPAHAVAHVDPAISNIDMIYSAQANGMV
jgi:hypothetical protein